MLTLVGDDGAPSTPRAETEFLLELAGVLFAAGKPSIPSGGASRSQSIWLTASGLSMYRLRARGQMIGQSARSLNRMALTIGTKDSLMARLGTDEDRPPSVAGPAHRLDCVLPAISVHPVLLSIRIDHAHRVWKRMHPIEQRRACERARSEQGRDRVFARAGKGDQVGEVVGQVVAFRGRLEGGETVSRILRGRQCAQVSGMKKRRRGGSNECEPCRAGAGRRGPSSGRLAVVTCWSVGTRSRKGSRDAVSDREVP